MADRLVRREGQTELPVNAEMPRLEEERRAARAAAGADQRDLLEAEQESCLSSQFAAGFGREAGGDELSAANGASEGEGEQREVEELGQTSQKGKQADIGLAIFASHKKEKARGAGSTKSRRESYQTSWSFQDGLNVVSFYCFHRRYLGLGSLKNRAFRFGGFFLHKKHLSLIFVGF